mmetsp:Transcript_38751/g.121477  ORF Transcript_38751/g.121477 Transcript_38751/m.121477 type:complete len:269 (-) Transcript_38751:68-874(-)
MRRARGGARRRREHAAGHPGALRARDAGAAHLRQRARRAGRVGAGCAAQQRRPGLCAGAHLGAGPRRRGGDERARARGALGRRQPVPAARAGDGAGALRGAHAPRGRARGLRGHGRVFRRGAAVRGGGAHEGGARGAAQPRGEPGSAAGPAWGARRRRRRRRPRLHRRAHRAPAPPWRRRGAAHLRLPPGLLYGEGPGRYWLGGGGRLRRAAGRPALRLAAAAGAHARDGPPRRARLRLRGGAGRAGLRSHRRELHLPGGAARRRLRL